MRNLNIWLSIPNLLSWSCEVSSFVFLFNSFFAYHTFDICKAINTFSVDNLDILHDPKMFVVVYIV